MTTFWDFALDFYARPGVSAACLTLQDEAGADVILLLTAIYADIHGRPLDGNAVEALREEMKDWREGVVLPLRAARRHLRAPLPGRDAEKEKLRSAVKAVELSAEKLQLALAEAWLQRRALPAGRPLPEVIGHVLGPRAASPETEEAVERALATILAARALPSAR